MPQLELELEPDLELEPYLELKSDLELKADLEPRPNKLEPELEELKPNQNESRSRIKN